MLRQTCYALKREAWGNTLHEGKECYCIEHVPTGYKAIFDHEEFVLNSVKERIHASSIVYNNGFRFKRKGDVPGVSLPIFLYAVYNGLCTDDLLHANLFIRKTGEYTDLRKDVLRRKGGINTEGIDLIELEGKRYIIIDRDDIVTILDYKEPLYQILIDRRFCGIVSANKRHRVMIYDGSGKGSGVAFHVARLVLLYNSFFERYESVADFWANILQLSSSMKCEASHIMADTWNCCDNNLMWMSKETNRDMYQYSNYFVGNYALFAVRYEEIILAEIQFASGYSSRFVCESPEEYKNMQRELLGKDIKMEGGEQVMSLLANKAAFTADGRIIEMPESARKRVNHIPEEITKEYVIHKIKRYTQDVEIPAKQHTRPGGTACCSASNGMTPDNQ